MRKLPITLLICTALAACNDHRDLYDYVDPMLHIESSWSHSLDRHETTEATAMLYRDGGMYKEPFLRPNKVTTYVPSGTYDIIVMNGVISSEDNTNLQHIYLRGTDRLETFEAYIAEGTPNRRISRADGEYIASNQMEMFSVGCGEAAVEGKSGYYKRYDDGGRIDGDDELSKSATTVELVPRAVTYRFQVTMSNILHPESSMYATGALRGFAGSVFVSTRHHGKPKAGFDATHHLNMSPPANNRTRTDDDGQVIGTIQSQVFVTFGPPIPTDLDDLELSGKFTFEPSFVLVDGKRFSLDAPIDITRQVNEAIERIYKHHDDAHPDIPFDENYFHIEITDPIELPEVEHRGGVVGVIDWEDDEIIMVWI